MLNGQVLPSSISYLALGDSYTIGASVDPNGRWPNQFIDSLVKLGYTINRNDIVATTGWNTRSLLNGMNNANLQPQYNLVSILIGVNNFYQNRPVDQYRNELSEIIDSALVLVNQDTNAVFLVTIPDYGYTPFGQSQISSISANTDLYNSIKDSTAKEYGIPVYEITEISREGLNDPDLVASDDLHPSAKQYGLWVDKIIDEMLSFSTNIEKLDFLIESDGLLIHADEAALLKVFDFNGKLLKQSSLSKNSNFKVELHAGTYVLNLQSAKGIKVSKVIIK